MAVGERHTNRNRRKTPSFSSSLLDAIYHSIDEPRGVNVQHKVQVEQEIESLRRAIKIEKWMENHSTKTTPRHLSSNSSSSTDSSIFSSSETESSVLRSSVFHLQKPKNFQTPLTETPKREGRFTKTKSRALKIYGDLKKVKEPISPGGKIANFLNSIFSPKILKKNNQVLLEWGRSPVRKSRSMKDPTTSSSLLASRSCLNKNPNKSKRSVRFCPVSVILDEDSQPCGHKSIHDDDEYLISASMPNIGSQFIKKNIDSFRPYEAKNVMRRHEFGEDESDVDDMSCASSDLFELENIGRVGFGACEEELPVYGTTSLKMNQAIASGLIM